MMKKCFGYANCIIRKHFPAECTGDCVSFRELIDTGMNGIIGEQETVNEGNNTFVGSD